MHVLLLLYLRDCIRDAWMIVAISEAFLWWCLNYTCCIWGMIFVTHKLFLLYLLEYLRKSRRPLGPLKGGVWGVAPPFRKKSKYFFRAADWSWAKAANIPKGSCISRATLTPPEMPVSGAGLGVKPKMLPPGLISSCAYIIHNPRNGNFQIGRSPCMFSASVSSPKQKVFTSCFLGGLGHGHIPSDTTRTAYASRKQTFRYNNNNLGITKTIPQIQQQ